MQTTAAHLRRAESELLELLEDERPPLSLYWRRRLELISVQLGAFAAELERRANLDPPSGHNAASRQSIDARHEARSVTARSGAARLARSGPLCYAAGDVRISRLMPAR